MSHQYAYRNRRMEEEKNAATLSVPDLILLNCIVCGLELVASAALVYLPPMLLEAGVEERHMSWVLGLGPFLCLFVVPILGRWMDTCTSRYGRRIPFMFALSLLVLLSLILIPYADHMVPVVHSNDSPRSTYSVHVYLLALTVVLIDFSTQAGLTPCEVFLQDITKGLPIRDRAFSLYSFMCSVGSCCGYLILAINWEKTFIGSIFGDQEYCVFSLLFVVFLILMVVNLRTAAKIRTRQSIQSNRNRSYVELQTLQQSNIDIIKQWDLETGSIEKLILKLTPEGIKYLFTIPYALRRLVYANFFAWAGVMAFLLFYTDYVGEIVYNGKPSAPVGTALRIQYDEGVRMGSFGLFLHAVMSSVAAPTIEKLVHVFGMRRIHLTSLIIFTVSILLILTTRNLILINALAMITGVAFASMTTIPFSLVGMYHEDCEVFFADSHSGMRGLGTDMAALDTSYFCSQVLLLSFMGYIVHLVGSAAMFLVTAAALSGVSCYFIYTAVYEAKDMPPIITPNDSATPTIVINGLS